MSDRPHEMELQAYREGLLSSEAFARVDGWVAAQPEAEQERLLAGVEEDRRLAEDEARPVFAGAGGFARYRLHAKLGDGGMGTVREVEDTVLERRLALKSCRARREGETLAGHDALEQRFRREATILAQLEHPGIVAVHDAGLDEAGSPAFAMELLDGQPLDRHLLQRSGGRGELPRRVRLVTRVAEALAYAHRRGVVHRDLKPENVIAGELGDPTIIDWGLAARVGTAGEPAAGTPGWLAPEQAAGAVPDPRQDVWALGGLLRFVLSGDRVPRAPSLSGKIALLTDETIPRGLVAVIRRCLERDPADRYADAGEVLAELERWQAEGITRAQRPSLLARCWAWNRRHPVISLILLVAALTVLSISGWRWWERRATAVHLRERVQAVMNGVDFGNASSLLQARRSLQALGEEMPLPEIDRQIERVGASLEVLRLQDIYERLRRTFWALDQRYDRAGPWATETADRLKELAGVGLTLRPDSMEDDLAVLRAHPLKDLLIREMISVQRSSFLAASPEATRLAEVVLALITRVGDPAEMTVSKIYATSRMGTHQLEFGPGYLDHLIWALRRTDLADLLLQSHRPEEHLATHVAHRLKVNPAAFWPRLVAARSALNAGRPAEARTHALVALGARADSLWPRLLLAYAAMELEADDLLEQVEAGLAITPDHLELKVLQAVGLARTDRLAEAQQLINATGAWAHYRYHLQTPAGHPMDRSVKAMVDAGVVIPAGEAKLGPVVE